MTPVSLHGLARALWAVTLIALVSGSAVVVLGVTKGYRVRVSPEHVDNWIGSGDLVVLTNNTVSVGEVVVVQGLQPSQPEGIARITAVDRAVHRIEVVDSQGSRRQIARDRVVGKVAASVSGLGQWLTWLSRPSHLVVGLVLPLAGLVGLEIQSLSRIWHTAKHYKAA